MFEQKKPAEIVRLDKDASSNAPLTFTEICCMPGAKVVIQTLADNGFDIYKRKELMDKIEELLRDETRRTIDFVHDNYKVMEYKDWEDYQAKLDEYHKCLKDLAGLNERNLIERPTNSSSLWNLFKRR